MNNIPKVVIIGNIAYDINTFPNRRDKKVVNLGGACLFLQYLLVFFILLV